MKQALCVPLGWFSIVSESKPAQESIVNQSSLNPAWLFLTGTSRLGFPVCHRGLMNYMSAGVKQELTEDTCDARRTW